MLDFRKSISLLDMSGMYGEEGFSPDGAMYLDFRELEGTRCLCDGSALSALRSALAPLPPGGIHWIDGGDWHYLSLLWMERIREPFRLVLIDNHSDDQPVSLGDILGCGSWVLHARRSLPLMVSDCWIRDAVQPEREAAGAGARRCAAAERDAAEDATPVYISIDLDALSREHARTNWDQGGMSLKSLLELVRRISERSRIIGVDVCGGITPDQGGSAEDLRINLRTRMAIQEFLLSLQNQTIH